jgi:hypothetical protein
MYTTTELIDACLSDPLARQALLEALSFELTARLNEDHIQAALYICEREAMESSVHAGEINMFGERNPDRSNEWREAAERLYDFAWRLRIRPPADYP